VDERHSYFALRVGEFIKNKPTHLGDVRDKQKFTAAVLDVAPDFIFHLAAQPIVSTSYIDPYLTFTSNVLGVLNILEILRTYDAPVTSVIITSDKCYKNVERAEPYVEADQMGGDDPYSASKGAAELVFHSYNVSYPKRYLQGLATVRAGNVFGGGDWSTSRLIPDCARDLFRSGVVEIRMPNAVRPWTFVVDILFGYALLGAKLQAEPQAFRGSWNFASGETKTVAEVVHAFISGLGFGTINVNQANNIGKEAGLLLIDPAKANQKLGWASTYSVEDAIKLTANWYRSQRLGSDMLQLSSDFLSECYIG